MLNKRTLISWMLSSFLMFGISYVWHGIFLNDIHNLNYPLGIYLISASVVYLLIGFFLTRFFSAQIVIQQFRNFFLRGICCGASFGLVLYMFSLVIGVSFTKNMSLGSILVDAPWQMFEQSLGGLMIATVFALIYEPLPRNRSHDIV